LNRDELSREREWVQDRVDVALSPQIHEVVADIRNAASPEMTLLEIGLYAERGLHFVSVVVDLGEIALSLEREATFTGALSALGYRVVERSISREKGAQQLNLRMEKEFS
jgi:hypothetical protein